MFTGKIASFLRVNRRKGGGKNIIGDGDIGSGTITIDSIDRDTAGSAGGAHVTVFGTGMHVVTTAAIGPTNAQVVATSVGSVEMIVPPMTPNATPYNISLNGGAAVLNQALTILPSPTTTFAAADFEDGTFGGWTASGGITIQTIDGKKYAKCTNTYDGDPNHLNASTSQLRKLHTDNPARNEANGKYTRWYILLDGAALSAVVNDTVVGGQYKLYLYRDTTGSGGKHGFVFGIGTQFRGLEFAIFMDWNNIPVGGVQLDGSPFFGGDTGFFPAAQQRVEIQLWEKHDGTTGYGKLWINGRRLVSWTQPDGQDGDFLCDPSTTFDYETRIGIPYAEKIDGVGSVYVGNPVCANGFIDPETPIGSSTILFEDDFATGLNKTQLGPDAIWQWGATPQGSAWVDVVSNFSHLGATGKCVRCSFRTNDDSGAHEAWSQLALRIGEWRSEYWITWWTYFPAGGEVIQSIIQPEYIHRKRWNDAAQDYISPANNKYLALYEGYGSPDYPLHLLQSWSEAQPAHTTEITMIPTYDTPGSVTINDWERNCRMPKMEPGGKGQWIKNEFHAKLATALGVADGLYQYYLDGVLKCERTGINNFHPAPAINKFKYLYLMGYANSGFPPTSIPDIAVPPNADVTVTFSYISGVKVSTGRLP